MALPTAGTRPVVAILVAIACGGLATIVLPRFDLSGTVQVVLALVAALVGFGAVYALGRRTTTIKDAHPPRT